MASRACRAVGAFHRLGLALGDCHPPQNYYSPKITSFGAKERSFEVRCEI